MDGARRMRPEEVAAAIDADRAAGVTPIACVASAGTTLTGAVDPIGALAAVCGPRGVWLHVDGAYGLPAAAAPSTRDLFAGLELADSVSVDAHKWLYLPKACGVVLVRDESALLEAFAHDESYMLHDENERHAVDTTLEYSRPFRALKLWLAFRTHGAGAFRDAIERNLAQARLLRSIVDEHDDLEVVGTPGLSIVPFRHIPGDGRDIDAHNLELARRLQADGRVSWRLRWSTAARCCGPASSTSAPPTTTSARSSTSRASSARLPPGHEREQPLGEALGRHAEHDALMAPDVRGQRREQRIGEVLAVGAVGQLACGLRLP